MAKEKLNQIKKPKKPLREVLFQSLKKLIYLLIVLSIAGLIYLINNSKLFEPSIAWEINSDFENLTKEYDNLEVPDIINKYFLETITHQYDDLVKPTLINKYFIELSKIKEKVEDHPWVSKATVERVFWNKIKVTVENHDIAMRWGTKGFISSHGVLFQPRFLISSDAPIGVTSEEKIEQFYTDFTNYKSILDPVEITHFERSNIDQLTLDSNIKIILGYQKQNERLELFVKVYENLKKYKKVRTRGIFDMRYPKGFALSYSPL